MKILNVTATRQDVLKTTADAKAMRLFVLLVFLLLSCSGVFGQTVEAPKSEVAIETENVTDKGSEMKSESASSPSRQLELVQWFMGAKQVSPSVQPAKTSEKAETAKKILINSGMTPNRILSRTLLKKAMQYENNIA